MRQALGALTTKVTEGKQAGGGQIEQQEQQREIQAANDARGGG